MKMDGPARAESPKYSHPSSTRSSWTHTSNEPSTLRSGLLSWARVDPKLRRRRVPALSTGWVKQSASTDACATLASASLTVASRCSATWSETASEDLRFDVQDDRTTGRRSEPTRAKNRHSGRTRAVRARGERPDIQGVAIMASGPGTLRVLKMSSGHSRPLRKGSGWLPESRGQWPGPGRGRRDTCQGGRLDEAPRHWHVARAMSVETAKFGPARKMADRPTWE